MWEKTSEKFKERLRKVEKVRKCGLGLLDAAKNTFGVRCVNMAFALPSHTCSACDAVAKSWPACCAAAVTEPVAAVPVWAEGGDRGVGESKSSQPHRHTVGRGWRARGEVE